MAYNLYGNNQPMINQLMRYKDNIDNMINQMNTPQPPVQNIINTTTSVDFEARILNDEEEVENTFVNKRTMFLDKKNKRVAVKEVDGSISEEYEIIIPMDEKDKKIQDLERRLKEMEEKINVEHTKSNGADDVEHKSDADDDTNVKSTTKANAGTVQKSTK